MFIHRTARSDCARRGGFTLLEVIAALALISLVIGGVYGVADGAMKLSASMNRARTGELRVSNFIHQWRDWLEAVPPTVSLNAGLERVKRGAAGNLLVEGGPPPFAWCPAVRRADAVEFALVRGKEPKALTLMVRHLKRLEKPTALDEFEDLAELPLLTGLREFKTQFYDPAEKRWYGSWDAKKRARPPLFMRVQFSFLTDPREHEATFWVADDLVGPSG
ncbi:prepilin-type N-terminal cleavage/methylation domain-containing protein [Prosthecobacter fusiformis]|uniref:Prepilin-type N-terminal cleavage/methylation domain-containing protein n=1 Tax=Prosthecobacter fusiformis TaxID=48464 RepID=A0A4R7RM85_9BACT|nr:prepilin-type N-terminal cleavage/methylation domain-containing protein [Prosthecobacter fusiformis]TDU64064.1 prepilin-type N-terminal cleavage/methylation domain-containing protein [Prosthecobacter fusiformis]